ncbi:MAG: DUF6516 family protein [Candidatus Accumulibacter sp.]|nr:DUF6516 family protein [Accumulibacter sp.]
MAYVVDEVCVLRYDNEVGKGDHRHCGQVEESYEFVSLAKMLTDFQRDIERWNRENDRV